MHDLLELAVIWVAVLLASVLAKYSKLTSVLWFLAFGTLLVNLNILPTESSEFISAFSEFGIITIMFALGFEENSSNFIKGIKRSWGIAFFGALAPFLTAYSISFYFWQNSNMSLIIGLAMTATAVSLTMVSLKSEGLHKTSTATGIMTSAVIDDIASLALVAILIPLATGQADVSLLGISVILAKAVLFFCLVTFFGMIIFPHQSLPNWVAKIPLINHFGIIHLLAFDSGKKSTLTLLLLALLTGLLAYYLGFHPAVGAYMAGLVIKEEYFTFEKSTQINQYANTKKIIDDIAFSWIGPIFFVVLGTRLILDWDVFVAVIPQTITLTCALLISQILSASIAARFTGGFRWHQSWMIGIGMLGRAELAFVVMDIGYVQNSLINTEAFYTLMFTAFWLNLAVPLGIRWYRPYFIRHENQRK